MRACVGREAGGRNVLPKQIKNPHAFHAEADEGPAEQDQRHAGPEGGAAAPFLAAGEEEEGALGAEEEGYAY